MTLQEAADRYRARRATQAVKWGLRVARVTIAVLFCGRAAGYYHTPWAIVSMPLWGGPALGILAIAAMLCWPVVFTVLIILRRLLFLR